MKYMDDIDRKIIQELKKCGNISNTKLAKLVGLSKTPCRERVMRLENEGIIKGYTIITEQERTENEVTGYLLIATDPKGSKQYFEFSKFLRDIPEVVECFKILGEYDFFVKVLCDSPKTFSRVHSHIQSHPLCGKPLTVSPVALVK